MGRKKGVKQTDTPKDKTIKVRLDDDTNDKLNSVCKTINLNKSEVIRRGIHQQYDAIKK